MSTGYFAPYKMLPPTRCWRYVLYIISCYNILIPLMRDYIYIFNNNKEKYIIASGIEFKDFVFLLKNKNLILLEHGYTKYKFDQKTQFYYILTNGIKNITKDNIYSYGNFTWVDFDNSKKLSSLKDKEIAELLFFSHMGNPYRHIHFKALGNKFLCFSHDDGWYLKLYYYKWSDISILLKKLLSKLSLSKTDEIISKIKHGQNAFWITKHKFERCAKTHNIDELLGKKLSK